MAQLNFFVLASGIFIFFIGTCIGSFLNVLIIRLRQNKQWWKGRSECPSCHTKLSWYELIPLVSWFALAGKCRLCKRPIDIQYPLVELASGVIPLLAFAVEPNSAVSLWYTVVGWWLLLIFVYDLRYYLILDKITLPFILVAIIVHLVWFRTPWFDILSGATIGGAFFGLQFLVSQGRWIGGGDVRLGFLMGVLLGWKLLLLALFLAYILGALVAMFLLVTKRKTFKSLMPFGTFLSLSTFITLLWGRDILALYGNFLGVSLLSNPLLL